MRVVIRGATVKGEQLVEPLASARAVVRTICAAHGQTSLPMPP